MPTARHRVGMLVVAALVLALAGCGGDGSAGEPEPPDLTPPATTADTPEPAPATGTTVPDTLDFQATTVDGGTLDAASLAGQPVVFWFWAAWCPRCAAFAADLREVQAEYDGRVHVVGVAGLGSGADGMREFVDQHDLAAFPHLADDEGDVWVRFEVTTQEYLVILDATGEIVHTGPLPAAELRDQLAALAA